MKTEHLIHGACSLLCALALGAAGCPDEGAGESARKDPEAAAASDEGQAAAAAGRSVDLPRIREGGTLRVLMVRQHGADRLPRGDFPLDHERDLAADFAGQLGLEAEIVYTEGHDDLIPALLEGRGDLIVASLTVTPARRKRVAFSAPIDMVREQVVCRQEVSDLAKPADLDGRELAVRPSSSYHATLTKLQQDVPGLTIEAVDERLDTEQIIQRVATGELELTVADSSIVEAARRYLPGIKAAFDLTDERPVAWAVRPDAPKLLESLNLFLGSSKLLERREAVYRDDLPGLKKRGVLRVLTRNNATTYYLHRGELVGFEYDLAQEFAKRHGLKIEIMVPPARTDLLPWLLAGRGDVVAAGLTATERRRDSGVALSRPYNRVTETVVGDGDDEKLSAPADLAGRTLVVRRDSPYWQTLEQLRDGGIELKLEPAPAEMETEQIIGQVAAGDYDLTVADSHILAIEQTYRDDAKALLELGEPVRHAWAVHPDNQKLLAAIDSFFDKEVHGLFYNVTRNKYFKNERRMRRHTKTRPDKTGRLSPYDDLVKHFAERFVFDWRLIVSQMYAESRFNPKAKSWVGARGLLQVMPRTAREMGLTDLEKPRVGIHAGVRYLNWTRDRFDPALSPHTRNWFALAAYNAGIGHVIDARELARRQGLDPELWFDHVERTMLLLAERKYARQARYGYCRGSEPVHYVRSIRERWRAYKRIAEP